MTNREGTLKTIDLKLYTVYHCQSRQEMQGKSVKATAFVIYLSDRISIWPRIINRLSACRQKKRKSFCFSKKKCEKKEMRYLHEWNVPDLSNSGSSGRSVTCASDPLGGMRKRCWSGDNLFRSYIRLKKCVHTMSNTMIDG